MIKFRIWADIRGAMTYMQLVVPIGYEVWVWCDLTLSIKLLTVRSWRNDANTVLSALYDRKGFDDPSLISRSTGRDEFDDKP